MRAGSFFMTSLLAYNGAAMTPAGVFPVNTENMTNFFQVATLATNGANIPKASTFMLNLCALMLTLLDTSTAPTVALDKELNGTTFAIIMFDPDTPATGIGGNGTNSFLHWFQDGLISSATSTKVGGSSGKTVFTLINSENTTAVQSYVYVIIPYTDCQCAKLVVC
jgi:phosphatidylethanolamine-binding protein (PEBP) family uncharacterized protein